jgi:hypothetical protein
MSVARRHARRDQVACGYWHFIDTGVEIGCNGIAGLLHYIPVSQTGWVWEQDAGGHQYSEVWDGTASRQNIRITSILAAANASWLDMRILMPQDFGSFPANAIAFTVQVNDITTPTLNATLYNDAGIDAGISAVDILPVLPATYTLVQLTPADVYAPGDWVTLDVAFTNDAVGQYVEMMDISITYTSARGNV